MGLDTKTGRLGRNSEGRTAKSTSSDRQQAPKKAAASPYRLPDTVAPVAYRITIEPDLDKLTFSGAVEIDLEILAPTKTIELNALDLDILGASLGETTARTSLDRKTERVSVVVDRPLQEGAATLAVRFAGTISDTLRGFYRSSYAAADGSKRWLATTQFEATNARRAFPCFDEPALKSTFEVTILVPDGRTAISNMPVARQNGRRVTFAPTPRMSTYLLMFAIGEFESIESATKDGVPVRVHTTPGRTTLGRFALDVAVSGLEWFDRYYGIAYGQSIPKCDLVAIPDFEAGAMENWGALTCRETEIFVDPDRSSIAQRRRVAQVVLHELAHQWFGNLVSPEWWSYLWLNESFATFMSFKAMDALFPGWKVWEDYVDGITSGGIALDSLRSSHPVEMPVADPNEIEQIFDAISYNKGGSVLRMLEQAIGEKTFQQGIALYLRRHQYANAASDDLWDAIGEASGTDIRSMMNGWTRQAGLPVVIASRAGTKLKLAQERFFLDRDPANPSKDKAVWDIPVSMIDTSGNTTIAPLKERMEEILAPEGVKLNAGQCGFYLSHYDDEGWSALADRVGSLPALDRYGLQSDAYVLMRAGYLPVGTYLSLLHGFGGEENYHVWSGLVSGLRALAEIFVGDDRIPRLESFARELLHVTVEKVGWDERPGESPELQLLRAIVLDAAIYFGDKATVDEVDRRFAALRENLESVPPNLQGVVFTGAARHGGDDVLDQLITLYEKVPLPETKVQLLKAMGAFRLEAPLRRAIAYTLHSGNVRPQDSAFVFSVTPIETRPLAWALIKENWETIDNRFGESSILGRIVSAAAGGIPSEAHAKDVEEFFKLHPAPRATEAIKHTLEGIRARAKFRARNGGALEAYFDCG